MRVKWIYAAIIVAVLLILIPWWVCHSTHVPLGDNSVRVFFSPDGGCAKAIVGEITDGKSQILVQAYSFTSSPIAKALLGAYKRGVKVAVILDKSQRMEKYSAATFLANSRIPTFIDDEHGVIFHILWTEKG